MDNYLIHCLFVFIFAHQKNIPLFFKKHHEEFLKTSNVFSKTSNVFFKTTVCIKCLPLLIFLLDKIFYK